MEHVKQAFRLLDKTIIRTNGEDIMLNEVSEMGRFKVICKFSIINICHENGIPSSLSY